MRKQRLVLQIVKDALKQEKKRQDRKSTRVWWRLTMRKEKEWQDNILIKKQRSREAVQYSVSTTVYGIDSKAQMLFNITKMLQTIYYLFWTLLPLKKSVLK